MKCSICGEGSYVIYTLDDKTLYCPKCWFKSGNKLPEPPKKRDIKIPFDKEFILTHVCDANCRNWGERLVLACTQELFKKYVINPKLIRVVAEPTMEYDKTDYPYLEFGMNGVEILLNNTHAILIGGGGTFNFLRYHFGKVVGNVHRPLIVFASGWNRLGFKPIKDDEEQILTDAHIQTIKEIQRESLFFSVRKDGTRQFLEEYGISSIESPDPAIFADEFYDKKIPMFEKPYVVISIGGDYTNGRFTINDVLVDNLADEIVKIVEHLLSKSKNLDIVITQHREQDFFFTKKLPNNDRIKFVTWEELMSNPIEWGTSIYANADFIIASRGHALYLAVSYGIPFIAISDYKKIEYICEAYGMEDYCFRITENNLSEEVNEAFDTLKHSSRVIKRKLAKHREEMKGEGRSQCKEIAEKITKI